MDSLFQFGFEKGFHHLGVTGSEEKELRFRSQFLARFPCFQNRPEFFRDGGSSGGADHMNLFSGRAKSVSEQGRLRGFSASFASLQCDESASHC